MTVDFSDWVEAVDKASDAGMAAALRLIVGLVLPILVIGVAWCLLRTTVGKVVKLGIVAGLGVVVIGMSVLSGPLSPVEAPSFTTVAQERFHVGHLVCDPACPTSGLPDDGTKVAWLDDGRNMEGRLYVHGTRVTLAPDAGAEGKETAE